MSTRSATHAKHKNDALVEHYRAGSPHPTPCRLTPPHPTHPNLSALGRRLFSYFSKTSRQATAAAGGFGHGSRWVPRETSRASPLPPCIHGGGRTRHRDSRWVGYAISYPVVCVLHGIPRDIYIHACREQGMWRAVSKGCTV